MKLINFFRMWQLRILLFTNRAVLFLSAFAGRTLSHALYVWAVFYVLKWTGFFAKLNEVLN